VLPTPELSADSLERSLGWLMREESTLQATLARRIPQLQDEAKRAAARVSSVLA
jgi:colanic acid/amylovoran biosynthesis protein